MSWTNRVVWHEGMFLRAQHFQQQDRWLEAQLRERTASLRPHGWGVADMLIDRDLLATGRFALAHARGVFPDGTPFAMPGDAEQPPPLELAETVRNALVLLAVPVRQAGSIEIASDAAPEGRYGQHAFEAYDTHGASPLPNELQIGRLRLRYLLETENTAGFQCIPVARVTEVGADRRVTLDDRWIAPALVCSATPPLAGWLVELAGMLNQRGESLAARLTAPGARGVADVSDFLLLQSVNRAQNLHRPLGWFRRRASRRSLRRADPDGRRFRHLHRTEPPPPRTLPAVPPHRPAAQLRPRHRRPPPLAVCRHRADRDPRSRSRSGATAFASAPSSTAPSCARRASF